MEKLTKKEQKIIMKAVKEMATLDGDRFSCCALERAQNRDQDGWSPLTKRYQEFYANHGSWGFWDTYSIAVNAGVVPNRMRETMLLLFLEVNK